MLRVRLALRNCFIFFFFCFLLACSFFLLRRHFDTCCVRDLLRVFASLTRPCCRQGSAHILNSCFPSDFVIPAGQCRILWLRGEVRRPREEPMEAQRDQRATKLRRDLARHWVSRSAIMFAVAFSNAVGFVNRGQAVLFCTQPAFSIFSCPHNCRQEDGFDSLRFSLSTSFTSASRISPCITLQTATHVVYPSNYAAVFAVKISCRASSIFW